MPVADLAEYSWDFNPRINLFKQAVLKAGDLRTHLRAHIGAAAGAPLGTVPDGGTLVDSTLNRLAVTQAVVQYEPPATGGGDPTDGGGGDGGGGATTPGGGGAGGGGASPGVGGGTTPTPPAPAELRLTAKLAKARFPGRKGTKLALGVSERARVTIKLVRSAKGRRAGKRCVARAGRGKACSLVLERRTVTVSVAPGAAPVAFGRKLRRGAWSGTAVAVDGSGRRSKPIIFRFTVA
jgi:hypothetical protein